jgi:hypothetical protein
MNLPFKIASQYLFTDRFFSREGLIINSISSLLILILMYFNIEWGVPFLIMQLLPFSFIKENTLYNWGVKLAQPTTDNRQLTTDNPFTPQFQTFLSSF